jgi:hypothetical protein
MRTNVKTLQFLAHMDKKNVSVNDTLTQLQWDEKEFIPLQVPYLRPVPHQPVVAWVAPGRAL